jgi:hypothetical protein
MNKTERDLLKHALGLDYKDKPFRNHFVAGASHSDYEYLEDLVAQGFMIKRKSPMNELQDEFIYHCTDKGKEEAFK